MVKKCTKCGIEKELSGFYKRTGAKDGLQAWCAVCTRAAGAENRKQNIEKRHDYEAAYYKKNKEQQLRKTTAWYKNSPDGRRKHYLTFKEKHPERIVARNRNQRARKQHAEGKHTPQDVTALLISQRKKCIICECPISKAYHVDHIIALANGGRNDKSNIQLLCPTCNMRKGASDPIEFMQKNGKLL